MRRHFELSVASILALLLHVAAVAGAARLGRTKPLMPRFEFGESSVNLTLVAAPSPPVPLAPEPPPPEPEEPLPLFEPETAVLPAPEPPSEEAVEDTPSLPAPAPDAPPAPQSAPNPPELDGDMQAKGVLSSALDSSGVRPRYPLGARLRGEEGSVRLSVVVNGRGRAGTVEVVTSSGYSALDRSAVQAAWQASYIGDDGRAGAGETTFVVRFRLED